MFLKPLWPALLASAAVLILCVLPGQSFPKVGIINADKFVHSFLFGGLAFLYAGGFYRQTSVRWLNRHYLFAAFAFSTLYGGFIEILQATVAINRSGDWLDFLFDGLGALAAVKLLNPARNRPGYGVLTAGAGIRQNKDNRPG